MTGRTASKFGKFLALLALLGALVSCRTENNDKDIGVLLRHFTDSGLKIQTVTPLVADIVHAEVGLAVKMSGREVGVYKFDINKPKQRERLESIKVKKEMYVLGKKFTPVINGSFVMIDYEGNTDKERILDAFKSF